MEASAHILSGVPEALLHPASLHALVPAISPAQVPSQGVEDSKPLKRTFVRLTNEQRLWHDELFRKTKYPSPEEIAQLAAKCDNRPISAVREWFTARRAKERAAFKVALTPPPAHHATPPPLQATIEAHHGPPGSHVMTGGGHTHNGLLVTVSPAPASAGVGGVVGAVGVVLGGADELGPPPGLLEPMAALGDDPAAAAAGGVGGGTSNKRLRWTDGIGLQPATMLSGPTTHGVIVGSGAAALDSPLPGGGALSALSAGGADLYQAALDTQAALEMAEAQLAGLEAQRTPLLARIDELRLQHEDQRRQIERDEALRLAVQSAKAHGVKMGTCFCGRKARFGRSNVFVHCLEHKEQGETGKAGLCFCGKEASYGTHGNYIHCVTHKEAGEVFKKGICHCGRIARFGPNGTRIHCEHHKEPTDSYRMNNHCHCGLWASYGPNGKRVRCSAHREPGDSCSRVCHCGKQATFGPGGLRVHCSAHKEEGDVYKSAACHCGRSAYYGPAGGPRLHCADHKEAGEVRKGSCSCGRKAKYGPPGKPPLRCAEHKLSDDVQSAAGPVGGGSKKRKGAPDDKGDASSSSDEQPQQQQQQQPQQLQQLPQHDQLHQQLLLHHHLQQQQQQSMEQHHEDQQQHDPQHDPQQQHLLAHAHDAMVADFHNHHGAVPTYVLHAAGDLSLPTVVTDVPLVG